jgi:hypothetical protein
MLLGDLGNIIDTCNEQQLQFATANVEDLKQYMALFEQKNKTTEYQFAKVNQQYKEQEHIIITQKKETRVVTLFPESFLESRH